MKIIAAGGGSGGHVTPILAVINELKTLDSNLQICFITDRKFGRQATAIMKKSPVPVRVKRIVAGKFRRYHGISWIKQLADIKTTFLNVRDALYTCFGVLQSLLLILKFRPDVVFTKGGFVCLPVGFAAHMTRVPLVIHDSDAHPGLTNRVLARWATAIATGSPTENYPYPPELTRYVGIPVDASFHPVSNEEKRQLRASLGITEPEKPLVVVTGGGLGARNINQAMAIIGPQLLDKIVILHITGEHTYEETSQLVPASKDYLVKPFISTGMAPLFGAADVVITRAGATAMQELAAMAKPVIIVPNPLLAGGHQLKNAKVYEEARAAIVVNEDSMVSNPLYLKKAIELLIANPQKSRLLGERLHAFAKPEAAVDMTEMITEAAMRHVKKKRA